MGILTLILDDRDPSVSYSASGDWQQGGVGQEYNTTMTWTNISGATAKVTFSGTSINVYGTIANTGLGIAPQSSYSIDGGPATIYNASMLGSIQYRQEFFQVASLSAGSEHTLVVTTLTNGGYFYLDYFSIVPGENSSSSMTMGPSASLSSTSSTSSSSTPSITSPSEVSSSTTGAPPPLGAIIGGALGGLGLLVFTFMAFLFFMRKRRDDLYKKKKSTHEGTEIQTLWTRVPNSAETSSFMAEQYQTPFSDSDPNTLTPYPIYQNTWQPQQPPQASGQPFVASHTPSASMTSLNTKGMPLPTSTSTRHVAQSSLSNTSEPSLPRIPGPSAGPQHQNQHHRLPSRTENISSRSALPSDSSGLLYPDGGSTGQQTPRPVPASLYSYENPFETPPPQYEEGQHVHWA